MSEIKCEGLEAGYGKIKIINGVDLNVRKGEISVILGSNGSGKSTLLKSFVRLIKPMKGNVMLDNLDIHKMNGKVVAKKIGLLPQTQITPNGIKVLDVVARGRHPHKQLLSVIDEKDKEIILKSLEKVGMLEFAHKNIDEVSGGQRQRVWIAMALAQETDILFLDEPTTFLDITYQLEILDILYELNQKEGKTIVMVLHDINLASRYADYLYIMKTGALYTQGKPIDVITTEVMTECFRLDCIIIEDPETKTPMIVPKSNAK